MWSLPRSCGTHPTPLSLPPGSPLSPATHVLERARSTKWEGAGWQPVGEGKLWFFKLREHITQASEPADSLAGLSARDYFGELLLRAEMYKIVFNQTWNFFFFSSSCSLSTRGLNLPRWRTDCFILNGLWKSLGVWSRAAIITALAPKMAPAIIANQKAAGNLIIFLIGNQLISGSYQLESEGPLDETY